uniref:Uncharacterized protein n=1 Tax=Ixodes ricinus TaxID=34613 RepID=A0A6B0U3Q5_IXORI
MGGGGGSSSLALGVVAVARVVARWGACMRFGFYLRKRCLGRARAAGGATALALLFRLKFPCVAVVLIALYWRRGGGM